MEIYAGKESLIHLLQVTECCSLKRFLFTSLPAFSRQALQTAASDGCCLVDGEPRLASYKLKRGQTVELKLAPEPQRTILAEELPLNVLYEDSDLIVINKASGMLVHPTSRERQGTVANALLFRWKGLGIRPTFPHRLDRETSGVLVVAKTASATASLALQFSRRSIQKEYAAIVSGRVSSVREVYAPVGRTGGESPPWQVRAGGRPALSRIRPVEVSNNFTFIHLEPVTGRTNQLRIHCAAIGHPIAGDCAYGGAEGVRLCLHAHTLTFEYPNKPEKLSISAPVPQEFAAFWEMRQISG